MDIHILKRYFEGHCTCKDYKSLCDKLKSMESDQQIRELFQQHWSEFEHSELPEGGVDHLLDKIHQQIRLDQKRDGKWKRIIAVFERVAAILILPLILSFMAYYYWGTTNHEIREAYAEILCPLGTRTKFTLPDGTTGFLNSGSSLLYPVNFINNREVELSGEAFFDVVHNDASPFTVKSKHLNIIVEGTSFDVIAYESESIEEVILMDGKVEIEDKSGNSITTLLPDQRLTFNFEQQSASKGNVTASHYTSWTEGKLVFRNEDINQVALRLSRWYNAKITIGDEKLEDFTFHATFLNEPLDEVLKLLALTTPILVQEDDRRAEFDGYFPIRSIVITSDPRKINQFN